MKTKIWTSKDKDKDNRNYCYWRFTAIQTPGLFHSKVQWDITIQQDVCECYSKSPIIHENVILLDKEQDCELIDILLDFQNYINSVCLNTYKYEKLG